MSLSGEEHLAISLATQTYGRLAEERLAACEAGRPDGFGFFFLEILNLDVDCWKVSQASGTRWHRRLGKPRTGSLHSEKFGTLFYRMEI